MLSSLLIARCPFPGKNKDDKSKRSSDDQGENLITEIEHFLDSHKLSLFYYRNRVENCHACNLQLSSDACYGCLKCYMFLHKSCLEIPKAIQHPYHPHSLTASSLIMSDICRACKKTMFTMRYWCSEDDFSLHTLCAKSSMEYTPPLKHKGHRNHDLYCFLSHDSIGSNCKCHYCDQHCEGVFYTCFECDFSVHLKCIPIPPKVDYSRHPHPLTLKDSFREDESDVYYCYACGEQRNPNFPVYWCEECPVDVPYVAHVECIVSELDEFHSSSGNTSPKVVDEGLLGESGEEEEEEEGEQGDEIHSHDHPLILHAKEGLGGIPCDICQRGIEGDMRTCEICSDVYFHPSCADLPREIRCSLHSHSLSGVFAGDKLIMCGLCRNIFKGYRYECSKCSFGLETECAFLTDDQYENGKDKYRQVKIRHFSHNHELTLAKCSSMLNEHCSLCSLLVSGSTYCCLNCGFFLHESCSEAQQQIQPSYHLPHRLFLHDLTGSVEYCGLCRSLILYARYSCYECRFFVHFRCGNLLMSTLKHKFHEHDLFPFAPCLWASDDYPKPRFRCCKCSSICIDSFYRCVKCNLNVHPECIPLPKIVNHSEHDDPLTLMSCMCEDDSGVYYCNICQEPRNPNHPVYWCQECQIMECSFAAHVGCVVQEGDASLKVISWEDSEPIFGSLFDLEETDEISGYK